MIGVEASKSAEFSEVDDIEDWERLRRSLPERSCWEQPGDELAQEERRREALTKEVNQSPPVGVRFIYTPRVTRSATRESGASHVSLQPYSQ